MVFPYLLSALGMHDGESVSPKLLKNYNTMV